MAKMLIANRLIDGRVVFRAADGAWVTDIDAGQLIDDDTAGAGPLADARADERDNLILDPCLIDVSAAGTAHRPAALRETIRAYGPTIAVER